MEGAISLREISMAVIFFYFEQTSLSIINSGSGGGASGRLVTLYPGEPSSISLDAVLFFTFYL